MKLSVLPLAFISGSCISASQNKGENLSEKAAIVRLLDAEAVFASNSTLGRVPESRTIRDFIMPHIASVGIGMDIAPGKVGVAVEKQVARHVKNLDAQSRRWFQTSQNPASL